MLTAEHGQPRSPPPDAPAPAKSGGHGKEKDAGAAPVAAPGDGKNGASAPSGANGSLASEAPEPATIDVAKAPGKAGPMEVAVAAEVIRRVTRARQVVSLVSQVIIRSYDEEALHAEVCRHLVAFGGYLMAWVGLAEEEPEKLVRPVAHAGIEANFLSALKITWSNDLATTSPTSLAIQEQRPHVARNILKEPRFAVLREDAQLYGYTATCALPLQFAQYGMGVLTIHSMEPEAFNAEEVSLLRELANDLAAGVTGLRERAKRLALEHRLMAVVDAADDAIIGTNLAGMVTDWNAGATRLYGYSRTDAVGKDVTSLIGVARRHDEDARDRRTVAQGERVPRYETERRCEEGKILPVEVTMSPIFGADGDVCGSTSLEHDITRRRGVENARREVEVAQRTVALEALEVARLKGLEKLRKTFISEASHELNTPLTPLLIQLGALRESKHLTPEDRAHLVVAERSALRLRNLVKDMLAASRLETGRFTLELLDLDLRDVIDEAVRGVSDLASANGVKVHRTGTGSPVATADRERVSQVLFNFLTNAIGFTSHGGEVTVSAESDGAEAVVRVVDTGVGLTPEQIGQLFQPFSRPHEGRGTGPKGTGLGLFISKGIIEQHGGRVWAESPGPERGAAFCFSLPLAKPAGHSGARPPGRTESPPRPGFRTMQRGPPRDDIPDR